MSVHEDKTFIHPLTFRRIHGYFHTDENVYTVDQAANQEMERRIRLAVRYDEDTDEILPCNCEYVPRNAPKRCVQGTCMTAMAGFECPMDCAQRDVVHPCQNQGITKETFKFNNLKIKVHTETYLGLGLKAVDTIKKDEIVGEVCGVLRMMPAEGAHLPNRFCFPFEDPFRARNDPILFLDLEMTGNEFRYLNTACTNNAMLYTKAVGTQLRMVVKTTQTILKNHEITVRYPVQMYHHFRYHNCGLINCPMLRFMQHRAREQARAAPRPIPQEDSDSDDDDDDGDDVDNDPDYGGGGRGTRGGRGGRGGRGRGRGDGGRGRGGGARGGGSGRGRGGRGRGRRNDEDSDDEEGGRGRGNRGGSRGARGGASTSRGGNRGGASTSRGGGGGGRRTRSSRQHDDNDVYEDYREDQYVEGQFEDEAGNEYIGDEDVEEQVVPVEDRYPPNVFRRELFEQGMSTDEFEYQGLGPIRLRRTGGRIVFHTRSNPIPDALLQELENLRFPPPPVPENRPVENVPPPADAAAAGEAAEETSSEDDNNLVFDLDSGEYIREDQREQ